jgi:hypothetical protein
MRKNSVRLGVESLERRDNPALPAGVGGFLSLMDVYAIGGDTPRRTRPRATSTAP